MTFERRTFTANVDCNYLLHVPDNIDADTVLVLTLHGYSSNPEVMLNLTKGLVGTKHVIASLQAPNQHYLTQGLPGSQSVIGYNWGVRDHWESAVRMHHEMVTECLSILRGRFEKPASRCMLVGFSQPVGLNYRLIATCPDHVRAVIGICGGLPRDWEEDKYKPVTAAVLHMAREEDEFYPPDVARKFEGRLKLRTKDVEFHMLPGGHRFPSKASEIVQPWMTRVFTD